MAHQVTEYRAAGMDAIVAKPIDVEQLLSAIQDVLERSMPIAEEAAA
jgi:CheY-like chemotaxis protein